MTLVPPPWFPTSWLLWSGVVAVALLVLVRVLVRRPAARHESLAVAAGSGPAPAEGPEPESREMRVLRRQVEVLMTALEEWEHQRDDGGAREAASDSPAITLPGPSVDSSADPSPDPSADSSAGLSAGTAYADVSRRAALAGDLAGAVLAQWASDLEVLRGPLGERGPELVEALAEVHGADPVAVLRGCRDGAIALTAAAGPVRALLAPLDHLTSLRPAPASPPWALPALVEVAPPAHRAALQELLESTDNA